MAIDHVASAHTDAELALLLEAVRERLYPATRMPSTSACCPSKRSVQKILRIGPNPLGRCRCRLLLEVRPRAVTGGGWLVSTSALLLWDVLARAYSHLGFDALNDEAFKAMVLARIIEPTSKADTILVACQRDGTTVLPRVWDHLEVLLSIAGLRCGVKVDIALGESHCSGGEWASVPLMAGPSRRARVGRGAVGGEPMCGWPTPKLVSRGG